MTGKSFCVRVCSEGKGDFVMLKIFDLFFGMKGFFSGIFGFVSAW